MGLVRPSTDQAPACQARHLQENHRTAGVGGSGVEGEQGNKISRKAMMLQGKEAMRTKVP